MTANFSSETIEVRRTYIFSCAQNKELSIITYISKEIILHEEEMKTFLNEKEKTKNFLLAELLSKQK